MRRWGARKPVPFSFSFVSDHTDSAAHLFQQFLGEIRYYKGVEGTLVNGWWTWPEEDAHAPEPVAQPAAQPEAEVPAQAAPPGLPVTLSQPFSGFFRLFLWGQLLLGFRFQAKQSAHFAHMLALLLWQLTEIHCAPVHHPLDQCILRQPFKRGQELPPVQKFRCGEADAVGGIKCGVNQIRVLLIAKRPLQLPLEGALPCVAQLSSCAQVFWPTMPSAFRPASIWKAFTAAAHPAPKMLSKPLGS